MTRSKLTRGMVAGAAAMVTVASLAAIPTAASAQSYPYYGGQSYNGAYYDPCQRDSVNRQTTGGLTGAAIGAAVGSGIAARGVRTEGAVLGGLLGAVIGANVGNQSAACSPGQAQPYSAPAAPAYPAGRPYTGAPYDARPYGDGRDYGYSRHYGYNDPYYNDDYDNGAYYPAANGRGNADDCQLAESPIYLPDGRTQKRFVRVCRDASGRYQVVD
ncbi:MAG TPA: hypothetical protein VF138_07900 [Caulobacteraceae bacterium]